MQKYEAAYFRCTGCGSLQTEYPYWLNEAYANLDSVLDVGRAQRNLLAAILCAYILEKLGLGNREVCLDWGGAEGLFCRLMRDRGYDFYTHDKYTSSFYSAPYQVQDPASCTPAAAITAFEVLEHFANPAADLGKLFALRPRIFMGTTELYDGQGSDWGYLSASHGNHLFLYSRDAMQWIAGRFGFRYLQLPFLHLFVTTNTREAPEFSGVSAALTDLDAGKDTLLSDAIGALSRHMTGELWRYVAADHEEISRQKARVLTDVRRTAGNGAGCKQ